MSRNDDEALKKIAAVADAITAAHEGHDCAFEAIGKIAAAGARQALAAGGGGPAQVATPAYRASWDVTFGGKRAERGRA